MVKILEQKHKIAEIWGGKIGCFNYPCIMVICLNICPNFCRGLLIYGTMANKTAFSVSTCLGDLLHGPQLRYKIYRKEGHEEEEEGTGV